MPTFKQLVKHNQRPSRKYKTRVKDLQQCPQKRGICFKLFIMTPKKPNSAKRRVAKIKLSTKKFVFGYIPGEGNNLQRFSQVLVRGGLIRDLPGVHYTIIRGKLDLYSVYYRRQGRSKYGTKIWWKPKKKERSTALLSAKKKNLDFITKKLYYKKLRRYRASIFGFIRTRRSFLVEKTKEQYLLNVPLSYVLHDSYLSIKNKVYKYKFFRRYFHQKQLALGKFLARAKKKVGLDILTTWRLALILEKLQKPITRPSQYRKKEPLTEQQRVEKLRKLKLEHLALINPRKPVRGLFDEYNDRLQKKLKFQKLKKEALKRKHQQFLQKHSPQNIADKSTQGTRPRSFFLDATQPRFFSTKVVKAGAKVSLNSKKLNIFAFYFLPSQKHFVRLRLEKFPTKLKNFFYYSQQYDNLNSFQLTYQKDLFFNVASQPFFNVFLTNYRHYKRNNKVDVFTNFFFVDKFLRIFCRQGNKQLSEQILFKLNHFFLSHFHTKFSYLLVLLLQQIFVLVELIPMKQAGRTLYIPVLLPLLRRLTFSLKMFQKNSLLHKEQTFFLRILVEFFEILFFNRSLTLQKISKINELAFNSQPNMHFRWKKKRP